MIWKQIIEKLPNYNCISIDLSGHGLSDNPDHDYQWNKFSFELESLISEIYNPQLDLFYGDDSSGITLRKQLGSDSIKFIKQLASK